MFTHRGPVHDTASQGGLQEFQRRLFIPVMHSTRITTEENTNSLLPRTLRTAGARGWAAVFVDRRPAFQICICYKALLGLPRQQNLAQTNILHRGKPRKNDPLVTGHYLKITTVHWLTCLSGKIRPQRCQKSGLKSLCP